METRANYLMVGSFVLLFSLGLFGFVIWLAKFQTDQTMVRYDIFFEGSVTGLKEASAVRYSGVKVGEVVFIGLDRDNPSRVRALVEVEDITPIGADTVASLAIEGLTGGQYILLSGGTPGSPPLEIEPGLKRAIIPSKPSAFQAVMEGAPEVLSSANALLAQANELFGPENRAKLTQILDDFALVSGSLAARRERVGDIIEDTAETMANLRGATGALEEMAGALQEDSGRLADRASAALTSIETMSGSIESTVARANDNVITLLNDLQGTAKAFQAMAGEFQALAAENREPLRDFTQNGLYELTTLLTEARGLLIGLNRVTTEVERDPARFLFGNQQQGYETQQ